MPDRSKLTTAGLIEELKQNDSPDYSHSVICEALARILHKLNYIEDTMAKRRNRCGEKEK